MQLRSTLLFAFAALMPGATAQVPTFDNVVLGQVALDHGGTIPLYTDIYLPSSASAPTPCVVWIHGGGWETGSHDGMPVALLQLLDSGVALASASYRFSNQAIFPAQLHDVKGLVRHLRANATTYNIDPNNIACWGASAGGHLAALLATTGDEPALEGDSGGNTQESSQVVAAVDYFGPTDLLMTNPDVLNPPGCYLDHDAPSSYVSKLIGFDGPGQGVGVLRSNVQNTAAPFPEKLALIQLANPITHLSIDDAPIFIAHGVIDMIIPLGQSLRLHEASLALGRPSLLKIDAASGHGSLDDSTYATSRSFLLQKFALGAQAVGAAYCFGDTSGSPCPCSNFTGRTAYEGCGNSSGIGGRLRAEGSSSVTSGSVSLVASRMTSSIAIYLGTTGAENGGIGSEMSDGLICIAGPIMRFGTEANSNGASQYPGPGDGKIAVVAGYSGGMTRYFQVLYRDNFDFCKQSSYNLTNGVAITFTP